MTTKQPITIHPATRHDADAIFELQKCAFYRQGVLYNNFSLPPLVETIDDYRESFSSYFILKAECDSRIVGSVRGRQTGNTCLVTRLIVHPDYQDRGIGSRLMHALEGAWKDRVERFELFTGHRSEKSLYLYRKLGYRVFKEQDGPAVRLVFLEKRAGGGD